MFAENACWMLECNAKSSGTTNRLKRMKLEGHEIEDENAAREVQEASCRSPFRFSMYEIGVGEEVVFAGDPGKKAEVNDDRHGRFCNETASLSALAKSLLGCSYPVQGILYFKYKGKVLDEIRKMHESSR